MIVIYFIQFTVTNNNNIQTKMGQNWAFIFTTNTGITAIAHLPIMCHH